jgi:hypothetical protein
MQASSPSAQQFEKRKYQEFLELGYVKGPNVHARLIDASNEESSLPYLDYAAPALAKHSTCYN